MITNLQKQVNELKLELLSHGKSINPSNDTFQVFSDFNKEKDQIDNDTFSVDSHEINDIIKRLNDIGEENEKDLCQTKKMPNEDTSNIKEEVISNSDENKDENESKVEIEQDMDLTKKSLQELKIICKDKNIVSKGNKADIIKQLLE
jgi:hypothetical protein